MKNILLLLIFAIAIISCSKEVKPPVSVVKLDPMARIQMNIEPSKTKSNQSVIPGTWVTDSVLFMSRWGFQWSSKAFRLTFGSIKDDHVDTYLQYRDTINNKLFMSGWKIIKEDSTLNTGSGGVFADDCTDNVLTIQRYPDTMFPVFPTDVNSRQILDTIGYIPNKVFEQAKQATIEAYEAGDIDKCYEIFMDYFYFVPTTGAKWRAMKAAGIE